MNLKSDFTKNEIFELAREFKKRRVFLGLSQLKLAKIANLSQSIINKFENGKIDPTFSTILKIERALFSKENISNLKAKDIMTKEILSIKPNCKIFEAINLMRDNDYSQILVFDKENLVGTIYEKTLLDTITKKIDIYNETIKKFIETSPILIPENYSVLDLTYIFQNRRTKFVLVFNDNQKISGIITHSDLFKN